MAECNAARLESTAPDGRVFTTSFDGGAITSDGGVLLLQEVEKRCRILERFGECFVDFRNPKLITHSAQQLATQRVLALALGYEDLSDHDALRSDPLLTSVAGKHERSGQLLASSATLGRVENASPGLAEGDRHRRMYVDFGRVDRLMADLFIESQETPPSEVILDLDATDAKIHGKQQGRFFHGYYDEYCYLPLYIFAGDHVLGARLRRANTDGADGSVEELERIVPRLREAWPEVRIVVRADSGFCRDWLLTWCEEHNVDYVIGTARNARLEALLAPSLEEAKRRHDRSLRPERVFIDLEYQTRTTWSRSRRVVGKAEHLQRGANPRFVVTSFSAEEWEARALYEELYCARGDMENRIKEQQLDLFADRVSCHWERGNQTRLYFSAIAYTLLEALRRLGLSGTEMARAQCGTIRLRLLKVGARIRSTARRIWVHCSEHHPWQREFVAAWRRLRTE